MKSQDLCQCLVALASLALLTPACDDPTPQQGDDATGYDIYTFDTDEDTDSAEDTDADEGDTTATSEDTGDGDATNPGDTTTTTDTPSDTPSDTGGPAEAVTRSCTTHLEFEGNASSSVAIAGQFNDWQESTAIALQNVDGRWQAELDDSALGGPGFYAFKFIIDGVWEGSPPPSVYTQWDGDFENRSLRVRDCNSPEWRVLTPPAFDDAGLMTGRFQLARAASEAPLDAASVSLTVGGQAVTPDIDANTGVVSFSFLAGDHGKYSVHLDGQDTDGVAAENNTLYVPVWYEEEAFDWRDASLYLVFTDRFRDTDGVDHRIDGVEERANYLGGDFRGITRAIKEGYFDEMGINALWLSPAYDNTDIGYRDKRDDSKLMSGFHGYWPISLEPEPRYGDTEADAATRLHELIETAHAHGIRVLFDLALNHVHEDHPYCDENPSWCDLTCQCGSDGCGWDPVGIGQRGIDCQFDYFLPDLSYRKHDLLRRVIDDTMEMAADYDIDGMRIDAARHMDHVIMRTLRLTLRDEVEAIGGAPYYLVGETFTDDRGQIMDYVSDHELHGQFDFAMRSAIRYVFGPGNGPMTALDDAAAASESGFGYGDFVWSMSPFFGNHDIPRFATVIAGNSRGPWGNTRDLMAEGPADSINQWDIINRMSMSAAFLFAYKGVPLLYYGDEVGLAGAEDPDNRRFMPDITNLNANQTELLNRIRTLGKARRDIRSLRRGERKELWKNESFYVFTRHMGSGEAAIVALNKGDTRSEAVTIPAELGLEGKTLVSYNSDRTLTVTGGVATVTLDPWEYAIFYTSSGE